MSTIPHVLFQTNRTPLDPYALNMIKEKLGHDWRYEFYNDNDVLTFFHNNPCEEFPNIVEKYNALERGAHRADLFRYYYIYMKGGFFMDSDAMIYEDINNVIGTYDFVSVNSSCHPGTIFQGILGASPRNEIMKSALRAAYNTSPEVLTKYYHYWCKQLYDILTEDKHNYSIKLYKERRLNPDSGDDILDDTGCVIFKHYWKHKIIPNDFLTIQSSSQTYTTQIIR